MVILGYPKVSLVSFDHNICYFVYAFAFAGGKFFNAQTKSYILGSKLTKDNQGIGINSYNQGEQAGTGGKGTGGKGT